MQTASAETVTLHPPAKVNLCLELLGKRPDGFHELRTAMATVRWCDTLRLTRRPAGDGVRLRIAGGAAAAGLAVDRSNLVVAALEELREAAGVEAGVDARLQKRIPAQAGLGGGSSDAAAALVGGARVWGLDWPTERLAEIGARLGSDVPFFVHALAPGGSAFAVASGRGEVVRGLPIKSGAPLVIAKPPSGLSTAGVYAAVSPDDWSQADEKRCERVAAAMAGGHARSLAGLLANHLQRAAERVAPWIERVAAAFESAGFAAHQLSGSGSAYFGLARSWGEARRAAARLRALCIGQVIATTIG
ncbi:4-(cytidine 5'-diphospho)-2-C-methyl-D-erythritol kinase [Botrimarina sp.]|uniref:4-(cytidine 5'-diphospho)-2-C-methyl-D-erythritol kinase n=1 Tax=Botrimarina sp. TaxID=2795802 RepID=UPI0032EC062A